MEIYHVMNRGVEKRNVTLNDKDRLRFLHDLFIFNDEKATPNYILPKRHLDYARELLVHIHAFCLMPNHYHLLISPIIDDGIPKFMKKLNMGYAKYFNEKYKRSGALWQGKYKKVHVANDSHFEYVPYYIHLNPLDLKYPEWRSGGVERVADAIKFLNGYRWSSHLDYMGVKNFPSITQRDFLSEVIGSRKSYEKEMRNIIRAPDLVQETSRLN